MEIKSIAILKEYALIIDQTKLPLEEKYIKIYDYQTMIEAIKMLRIRGAPAIGVAAATAGYLAAKELKASPDFKTKLQSRLHEIMMSRPTAVNLFFAIEKLQTIMQEESIKNNIEEKFFRFANELSDYEIQACENMGKNGADEICSGKPLKILTHCNTGSLATVGIGTALGVIRKISERVKTLVFVDETRPLLQGARLTAWELEKSGIDYKLITDNMAASAIKNQNVDLIVTGADRIASNGDSANKIGTMNLAILANYFNIPFYIVAPESTIDRKIKDGSEIKIEQRGAEEIKKVRECQIAPESAEVFSPAFDVTPAKLISAIITDKQVYKFPYKLDK